MRTQTKKSTSCDVYVGDILRGKWNKNRYVVRKYIGSGTTGHVYLVQSDIGTAALKISTNNTSITSEVNILRNFSKVQGYVLGPCLLDVDDWVHPITNNQISFYVMEYIKGKDMYSSIQERGEEWVFLFVLQLLGELEVLHQAGYVFGDLKPENLIVTEEASCVRFIDVGGVTAQGRAIKEFTEFFDRGYWGMGTRKAEPSYDLFAVVLLMINVCYKGMYSKSEDGYKQLKTIIQQHPLLRKVEKVLLPALCGNYQSANEMKSELLLIIGRRLDKKQDVLKEELKPYGWKETMVVCGAVIVGYLLYADRGW